MSEYKYYKKKITLCGSTKFKKEFETANLLLTLQGAIVYSVAGFGHADNLCFTFKQKKLLDKIHKWKIDNSDTIFIIDIGGYVGKSTKSEINYAKRKNKEIIYWSQTFIEGVLNDT